MSIIHYDELETRPIEDSELKVQVTYCLQCPCGLFRRTSSYEDGTISITDCPRSGRHEFVYYHPQTGERYQKSVMQQEKQPIKYCEIQVACTYEETYIPLKDMLVIPEGWTLEVEGDEDLSDYIDLDMEMRLHRIPDVAAYRKWQMDEVETKSKQQREKDIVYLRKKLKELTGEEV